MLYTYNDIKELLSKSAAKVLADETNFGKFAANTETMIIDKCGTFTTAPDWMQQPYAWILEYLASVKLEATSPEYNSRITKNYDNAMKTLAQHAGGSTSTTPAKVGTMGGLYENE